MACFGCSLWTHQTFGLFLFSQQTKKLVLIKLRLAGLYAGQSSYTITNQGGVVQKSHWSQLTMDGPDWRGSFAFVELNREIKQ